jgi:nitroimidazol reductase NimA-like FMN-containing flavoprotein (pyridoxamine 5'-phosphate oxidase superfamily)
MMRRKEYQMSEQEEMMRLLATVGHGYLGAIRSDGWPTVVPLNFVYYDNRIYFHGAREGEKMESLKRDDRVTFIVVEDFSVIPSYYRDEQLACPATQYYKSVMVRGHARIVSELSEKARALQAMMEKLQPEGGHLAISPEEPIYKNNLKTTAVIAIEIESMTGKFKFGQNLPKASRAQVAEKLSQRGCPIDHATVAAMTKYNKS